MLVEPSHGDGMWAGRRKSVVSIALLLFQELIFQKHSSVGTSSRAVAHVTAWLEFVISSMRSSLAQPAVLALCGLVLCWTGADIELCQVWIPA